MSRWRLHVAYDGAGFAGWAAQPGLRTVQGVLAEWIPRVLRIGPVALTCAGRTDAGVHARGQVVHVDLPDDLPGPAEAHPGETLRRRLARVLPADVAVVACSPAPPGFDARFSALWRRYCYRLADRPPDPLLRGHVVPVRHPLDLALLDAAGTQLLGLRDFAAFCRRREGATTIRTLLELSSGRRADGVVEVTVRADAFCHSMVRSLLGAVTAVASGRRDLDWLRRTADAPGRPADVQVMPAHGLVLEEVAYPDDATVAQRAAEARASRRLDEVR